MRFHTHENMDRMNPTWEYCPALWLSHVVCGRRNWPFMVAASHPLFPEWLLLPELVTVGLGIFHPTLSLRSFVELLQIHPRWHVFPWHLFCSWDNLHGITQRAMWFVLESS